MLLQFQQRLTTSNKQSIDIESRKLVTDRAIAEAILSRSPASVLDLGCGEGLLVRYLTARNMRAIGIDAVASLIAEARLSSTADFYLASYEEICRGKLTIATDIVVCNFSLFGRESVTSLFKTIPSWLNPAGSFIVQTLHPLIACGDLPYRDGWREGSWDGFSTEFTAPPPWYFRTTASWIRLFADNGLRVVELREPIHPQSQKPASIIFIAQLS